jgi:hypothetical protein
VIQYFVEPRPHDRPFGRLMQRRWARGPVTQRPGAVTCPERSGLRTRLASVSRALSEVCWNCSRAATWPAECELQQVMTRPSRSADHHPRLISGVIDFLQRVLGGWRDRTRFPRHTLARCRAHRPPLHAWPNSLLKNCHCLAMKELSLPF